MESYRLSTRTVVALALTTALVPLNSTMIAVALPTLGRAFDTGLGTLSQWLVTSYLLVGIVLQSPGGKLGDRWGHRRVLRLGQGVFALGALAGFFARHLALVALARVLMAAAGAVIVPSAMALLRNGMPADRRARAFGLFGAVMSLAAALGPMLGGEVISRLGWSWLFLLNVPFLVLSALMARGEVTPEPEPKAHPAFDVLGSGLLGLGLTMLVLGSRRHGLGTAVLLGGGVIALVLLYGWERRQRDPVLDFHLFRARPFAAGSGIIALQNMAMYGMLFLLPFFFAQRFGEDTGRTGRALLAMMAMMVVGTPLGARISEHLGVRTTAVTGAVLALAGLVLLRVRTLGAPTDALAPLMLLGFGLALASAPSQASAMGAVDKARSGMAAGVMSTMRYLGGVAGIAVLGGLMPQGGAAGTTAQHHAVMTVFAGALLL
ncbi:MAG TPA: MFS transporter, partial [Myxococcaceae bacterium]|nr:MFS transporter [Myxococcaceae bacterium]